MYICAIYKWQNTKSYLNSTNYIPLLYNIPVTGYGCAQLVINTVFGVGTYKTNIITVFNGGHGNIII